MWCYACSWDVRWDLTLNSIYIKEPTWCSLVVCLFVTAINILPSCITLVLLYILTYDARKPKHKIEFYGADSHFFHSAYVTWSHVELWSAHAPARLSYFCCRAHFVRRDQRVECRAVRAGTHYTHVTWAHVILRVQLGCERRLNIEFYGADSHFCHSAYVTWSRVELWSAHAPARLSHFCCRTHFVRYTEAL